ncbi:hypothetical protein Tco_1471320, partial [Tanacetum coccineum]
ASSNFGREFPSAKELRDATDCHWVVAHVTPPSWKQRLREISIEQLCDIHDKAYMRQAVLDNLDKDRAYAKLERKCNEALQDLDKNLLGFRASTLNENGVETEVPPKTTQAILARQRERKAKSIMLLAIPDEYQLRFHTIKDAKSLWAAIKKGLDKAYDRFQKLISQLEIHVFEADIKGSSGSSSNSQNVAFLSEEDTNSINEINTANGVSTTACHSSKGQASSSSYTNDLMFSFFDDQSSGPQLDDEDLEQLDHDNLEVMDIKWQVLTKLRLNALIVIEEAILPGNVEH